MCAVTIADSIAISTERGRPSCDMCVNWNQLRYLACATGELQTGCYQECSCPSLLKVTRDVHRTHTPRGTSTGYSAATIDVTYLCRSHRTSAIAYTVFVYGHIQGVGVTTYRIYNNVHIVKLKRWGQTLRIIGNSWKNSLNEAP